LESSGASNPRPKWWKYRVGTYGRSSRINDITAAVLLCQLKRLPRLIQKRKGVCVQYDNVLRDLPWLTTRPSAMGDSTDSYYFYWLQSKYRDKLAWYLRERGIFTSMRYWPLHWAYGIRGSFPGAEYAARNTLLLPCHANLSKGDVNRIISVILDFGKVMGLQSNSNPT
jgi:dTDP-4-amino-4,6-dideoxygalactose transaminase